MSISELFISEYIEGSSNNKAIELFNGTGTAIDLSNYTIEIYFNGSTTAGTIINLTGTVADGDVFVLADNDADSVILAQADRTSTANFFNGDDAIVLRKNSEIIDVFGQLGVDPGSSWTGGGANVTLRRNSSVTEGDSDGSDAFNASIEWESFPQDTFDGLGSHIIDGSGSSLVINEVYASHTGTDNTEFIELFGTPGTSLEGLSLIVVESDSGTSNGAIDRQIDFNSSHVIGDNGFFLIGNPVGLASNYGVTPNLDISDNYLENSSLTVALVETTSIAGTSVTGGEIVLDTVALTDGGAEDTFFFDTPVIGPDGSFFPAGARRVEDGVDTDTVEDWAISDFNLGSVNTPTAGTGDNGGGGDEITLISAIQGNGASSPIVGQTVRIKAVVVGDFQDGSSGTNGDLNGFFVQEEDTDADGDLTTSEGLFVFDGNSPAVNVNIGDVVEITGTVTEFNGLTELSNVTSVNVISSANPLPTPATVNFPVASVENLEAFEGMQITIPETLFVTEYFNLDRFGEVMLSSDGSSNQAGTDGRLDQYTQFNAPDVAGFAAYQDAIATRQILLDDGQTIQNPNPIIHGRGGNPLSATNTLRGGDTVNNLSGVLSFGFDEYRIQPVAPVDFQPTNTRPETPDDVGGTLKVASLNVLNFFTTLDESGNPGSGPNNLAPRGADNQAEFDRQLDKLVTTLETINADIFGLLELENEFGGDQNGDSLFAIGTLVDALNARVGAGTYAYVDPGVPFVETGDAISVGAIYKTNTVQIAPGTTVEILTDSDLPALGLSGTIFDGENTNRAPIAVTFEELSTGETFTISVNHFKSKGGTGTGDDADSGDGQGSFNGTRVRAAQALDAWLNSDPTGSGDTDFLIVGDLNSYAQEDPITFLEGQNYHDLAQEFVGTDAYSYVFDGQLGTLDYALANESLFSQVTGATEWHINADEPDALDYNLDFGRDGALFDGQEPYRTSDHDPIILGLDLQSELELNLIEGTNGRDNLTGTDGSDEIIGLRGSDTLTGGENSDYFVYTSILEGIDVITDFELGIDLIDLADVLDSVGYTGIDAIADGYVGTLSSRGRTYVTFDTDGSAGGGRSRGFILVNGDGVTNGSLLDANNFVF